MKFNLKVTNCSIVLFSSLFSSSAQAQLDVKMLKEVTKYFQTDKRYFSPVIGLSALESGLIHNLRFYGSLDMGSRSENPEERFYSADKTHSFDNQKDAIFDLLHTLFRSPAGILDQHVAGTGFSNFHSIATPDKVALLLNYLQELTQTTNDLLNSSKSGKKAQNKEIQFDKIEDLIRKNHQELKNKYKELLLNNINEEQIKEGTKGLKRDVNDLLKFIANAVLQEQQSNPDRKFLYPSHTTEQIVLAYFCHKFNTQRDVVEFLYKLNDQIVDPTKRAELEQRWRYFQENDDIADNLLNVEDLDKIIIKPISTYTIDDIYALIHGHIFDLQSTPYFNSTLISNGQCYAYNRQKNERLNVTYADCAETSARHFMNLILYNPVDNTFNLNPLKKHIADHPNPYFEKFLEFYRCQNLDMVNDGFITIRSKWNEVIGDLNKNELDNIRYVKNLKKDQVAVQYELSSGIINLINVFKKLFSVSFETLEAESNFDKKKEWMEVSLTKLIETINPNYKIRIDFSELKNDLIENDLKGKVKFVIQNKNNNEELFSFKYFGNPGIHSQITELEQIKKFSKNEKMDHADRMTQFKKDLNSQNNENYFDEIDTNIWLSSKDKDLREKFTQSTSILSKLFDHKINDNNSIIEFFKTFSTYSQIIIQYTSNSQKQQLKQITSNLLKSFSWQDNAVFKEISPIIKKVSETENINEIFSFQDIQRHLEDTINFESLFSKYKCNNLKYIFVKDNREEVIIADDSTLNWLKSLRELKINLSQFERFEITQNIPYLTSLIVENAYIGEIKGFHHLANLKELIFDEVSGLNDFKFTQDMSHLTSLKIENSMNFNKLTGKIAGLEHLISLQELSFKGTKSFRRLNLNFTQDMPKLTSLNLEDSSINEINGLHRLSGLQQLFLQNTKRLRKLNFTQDMEDLTCLNLERSSVEEINGLHYLKSLRELSLPDVYELEKLNIQDMPQLTSINLIKSGIKEFIYKANMPKLQEINFFGCEELKSLEFMEDCKSLKINLIRSGITHKSQIKGYEFLDEDKIVGLSK